MLCRRVAAELMVDVNSVNQPHLQINLGMYILETSGSFYRWEELFNQLKGKESMNIHAGT